MDAASSAGWAFSVRLRSSSGPSHARRRDRLAERVVGGGEHGGGGGGGLGEGASHPDGLAPLAGEHEGDLAHRGQRRLDGVRAANSVHACRNRRTVLRSAAEDPPVTDTERAAQPAPTPRARRPRPATPPPAPPCPRP